METPPELKTQKQQAPWKKIFTALTFVALILLAYFLREQIIEVVKNLKKVNAWALVLMIPLQLWNYDAYARLYRALLKTLGHDLSYKSMYRLSLQLTFVNHVFPSAGVSGVSYFGVQTKKLGVKTAQSTVAQILKFGLIFISFQVLLVVGLLALAIKGHTNNLTILFSASILTAIVIGTLFAGFILSDLKRITTFLMTGVRGINRFVFAFVPKKRYLISPERAEKAFEELHDGYMLFVNNWRNLKLPMLYALAANFTEVATVYVVYIAFDQYVNIGAVILAYAVANFAGLLSVMPGGIGTYEALMTAVLATAGVKPEVSLPVTVMYRVLNMAIQLVPGYYFYQKSLRDKPAKD